MAGLIKGGATACAVLAFWGVIGVGYLAVLGARERRLRRADREWAQGIAAGLREKAARRDAEMAMLEDLWAMKPAEDRS